MYNECQKSIKNFQLTSDLFFGVALENIDACQEVIRILTGEDITLLEVHCQETILQLETHSIRIDIWAKDIRGRHVGLEMHPQSNEDRVRRNRYTLSSMDVQNLKAGSKYGDIPDVCGIYITSADFLKTRTGVNKVERIITHTGKSIPNGTSEYYVSLNCTGNTPAQKELLKYMVNSDEIMESIYFPNLVKQVRHLKETKEGEDYMCEIMDELIRKGEIRGEKRGIKKGKVYGSIETLRELNYAPEDICNHLMIKFEISKDVANGYLREI